MWIPAVIALAWIVLRRRAGLPLLPELSHPFAKGGALVQTEKGAVVIPLETPIMHPAEAADQGILHPHELVTQARAIVQAVTPQTVHALPGSAGLRGVKQALSQSGALLDPDTGNVSGS